MHTMFAPFPHLGESFSTLLAYLLGCLDDSVGITQLHTVLVNRS